MFQLGFVHFLGRGWGGGSCFVSLEQRQEPPIAEVPRDAKVAAISEKKRAWRAAERNKGEPRKRWSGEQRKRQAERMKLKMVL